MALFDDTRAAWGARAPKSRATVAIGSRTEKMAHWNGGPLRLFGKPHSACLAAVRDIQAEHQDGNGWADIGYNGLICPHARAIEGRGRDLIGAHCEGHNTAAIGLQFMLGKGEKATPAMLARAARFFTDCETAAGHILRPMGHRDGFATECPGDQIEAWVKAGMPGTNQPTQEDEFMDVKNPVTGERWPAEKALWSIWTYAFNAARDAAVARKLAEAAAKAGKPLTAKEIDDIAAATVAAFGKDYDANITLTPKES